MSFRADRVRTDYQKDIDALRERHGDETIVDWLERYYASPDVDRDDVMIALDIDYVGTFYELLMVYEIEKPKADPVEEIRQMEMMRLLLDGTKVPENLRIPASWKRQLN